MKLTTVKYHSLEFNDEELEQLCICLRTAFESDKMSHEDDIFADAIITTINAGRP